MRTFAAYYRVSVDNYEKGQSKSRGLGIDAQKTIVSTYCRDTVVMEFVETKSAKDVASRPVLQDAIKYCLENDCWLVVAKLDRLSRNVDDCRGIVQKLRKRIVFCDIPSEGEADMFLLTMYAAFAERERELISLRTSQALQIKLKREGPWQKGNLLGFSKETRDKGRLQHQLNTANNPNNIRAREIIKAKRTEGLNFAQIAAYLNEKQFKTSKNKEFSTIQVQRLA